MFITHITTVEEPIKGRIKSKLDTLLVIENDNDQTILVPHKFIKLGNLKDKVLQSTAMFGAELDTVMMVKKVTTTLASAIVVDPTNDRISIEMLNGKNMYINFSDLIKIEQADDENLDPKQVIGRDGLMPKKLKKPIKPHSSVNDDDVPVKPNKPGLAAFFDPTEEEEEDDDDGDY